MCNLTRADLLAYSAMINEAESKQELREELQYIRDDLESKRGSDDDEGGFTLSLTK